MIECIVFDTRELSCFFEREAVEITHFMAEINIVLFIACLFGSMRGKYQAFSYFFNIFIELLV